LKNKKTSSKAMLSPARATRTNRWSRRLSGLTAWTSWFCRGL